MYSKESIILSALSIFLFRLGSGNKYEENTRDTTEKCKINISKFINSLEGNVPAIKTVENFLKNLDVEQINNLMVSFFKDLMESKFFKEHSTILPSNFFLLAADCVHTHTYDHPHSKDTQGSNDCPCCLKRVYNKGSKNEE